MVLLPDELFSSDLSRFDLPCVYPFWGSFSVFNVQINVVHHFDIFCHYFFSNIFPAAFLLHPVTSVTLILGSLTLSRQYLQICPFLFSLLSFCILDCIILFYVFIHLFKSVIEPIYVKLLSWILYYLSVWVCIVSSSLWKTYLLRHCHCILSSSFFLLGKGARD